MNDRVRRIKALIKHKRAFLKVEKELIGKNTLRGYLHDADKLFWYLTPMPVSWIRDRHKRLAKHHNRVSEKDFTESVIDFECARLTKRNSPLTAREFVNYLYKENRLSMENYYKFQTILTELKL